MLRLGDNDLTGVVREFLPLLKVVGRPVGDPGVDVQDERLRFRGQAVIATDKHERKAQYELHGNLLGCLEV